MVSIFTFFNSVFSLPLLLHEAFISEACHWLAEPCGLHVLSPAEPHHLLLDLWSYVSRRWLDGQVLRNPLDIVKNLIQDSVHLTDSCLQSWYHCYSLFINSFISLKVSYQCKMIPSYKNLLCFQKNFGSFFKQETYKFLNLYYVQPKTM